MRYLEIPREEGRRRSGRCSHSGCAKRPSEQKPYCSDHLDELPYVKELLTSHDHIDDEHARVKKQGARAVDVNGHTACEILRFLTHDGDRSVAKLARDMGLEESLIKHYLRKLQTERLIRISPKAKGTPMVSLWIKGA